MDVNDTQKAIDTIRGYDVVVDGTPISVSKKDPQEIFKELGKREIFVHHPVSGL